MVLRIIALLPKMIEAFYETAIMLSLSSVAAILLGIPIGTLLYLSRILKRRWMNVLAMVLNVAVNIVRSFPFLLLIVALQPAIRAIYGRATGDAVAASFPLMLVAIALYARFVEQAFLDMGAELYETAKSMGASTYQFVRYFLLVEARSALVIGFTTAFVSFISYSTVMGVVGGGGIGDFAIRYGYQRYEMDIMYTAIVIMIVFVQLIQWAGLRYAQHLNKRNN